MKQFKAMMTYELMDVTKRKSIFIFSIFLPVIFFIIFSSMTQLPDEEMQKFFVRDYMLSMTTFSLTSFALFTFPVEMINDKKEGWSRALFRTPLQPFIYYVCKIIKIMMMYMIAIAVVFFVGRFYKGVEMSFMEWIGCYTALLFGGFIFLTFGLLLAQFKDTQKMSVLANVLYLGLAMLGGLWFPVMTFPDWLKPIAYATPTYHFKNIAAGLFSVHYPYHSIGIMLLYGAVFVILAMWIRKRTEVI